MPEPVAVPVTAYSTVTLEECDEDNRMVKSLEETDSAPLEVAAAKDTSLTPSGSKIVNV